MRTLLVALVGMILATTALGGILEHHHYTPSSLPSAQGWTFESNGFSESEVFALVDGLLVMNTMSAGMDGETHVWYMRSVANPDNQSAVFSLRARVTAYENDPSEYFRGFFLGGYAPGPGPWLVFGLQPGAVFVDDQHLADLDTEDWHEYTVVTQGLYPDTSTTFLVDGVVVAELTGDIQSGGITGSFAFGDMGRHANARVEISEMELMTFDGEPVADEPVTLSQFKSFFRD
jgi:hypothetical protein